MLKKSLDPVNPVHPVKKFYLGDHLVLHDLEGQLLDDQMKTYAFRMNDGKIAQFKILED